MPYKFHPPTRKHCEVCDKIAEDKLHPIIDTTKGKASDGNNHSIHNWYNFVLGYTPTFPNYIIKRENANNASFIVDPFMGSGTTLVCCKSSGIASSGIDANDFFYSVAKVKLDWNLDISILRKIKDELLDLIEKEHSKSIISQSVISDSKIEELASKLRPEMLVEKYISNIPFLKLSILKAVIDNYNWDNEKLKDFFSLAFSSIIVPSSNVRYGPGFGIVKPKFDIDVFGLFKKKVNRMIDDLSDVV